MRNVLLLVTALSVGCFREPPPVSSGDVDETVDDDVEKDPLKGDEHGDPPDEDDGNDDDGPALTSGGEESGESTSGSSGSDGGSDESSSSSSSGDVVLEVSDLGPGDLVITELMWDPGCSFDNCEWVELYNATGHVVDLRDLVIQDIDRSDADQGRIDVSVLVDPGAYVVLGLSADGWPYEFEPAAYYGPVPQLTNSSSDQLVILNAGGVIDETATHYHDDQGVAWALRNDVAPDPDLNDSPHNWCLASTELPLQSGGSEAGTPGAENDCV